VDMEASRHHRHTQRWPTVGRVEVMRSGRAGGGDDEARGDVAPVVEVLATREFAAGSAVFCHMCTAPSGVERSVGNRKRFGKDGMGREQRAERRKERPGDRERRSGRNESKRIGVWGRSRVETASVRTRDGRKRGCVCRRLRDCARGTNRAARRRGGRFARPDPGRGRGVRFGARRPGRPGPAAPRLGGRAPPSSSPGGGRRRTKRDFSHSAPSAEACRPRPGPLVVGGWKRAGRTSKTGRFLASEAGPASSPAAATSCQLPAAATSSQRARAKGTKRGRGSGRAAGVTGKGQAHTHRAPLWARDASPGGCCCPMPVAPRFLRPLARRFLHLAGASWGVPGAALGAWQAGAMVVGAGEGRLGVRRDLGTGPETARWWWAVGGGLGLPTDCQRKCWQMGGGGGEFCHDVAVVAKLKRT